MIFDHDEKIILMLYGEDSRKKTMESLKRMKSCLTPEEVELNCIVESVLTKLESMYESEFAAADLLPECFL